MARTYRNVPANKWTRTPRYKWKLTDGINSRHVITERDSKPVAAVKECRYQFDWVRGEYEERWAAVDALIAALLPKAPRGWSHIEPGFEQFAA